jgi:ABC-type transport system substrate-binding protein
MSPAVRSTLTANAVELVYGFAASVLERPEMLSGKFRFRVKPGATMTAQEIATKLVGKNLGAAHVEGPVVVVDVPPGESSVDYDYLFLDIGPFTPEVNETGHLVLRRRSGTGIVRIELIDVPSDDEEWRRFLARDVDLVPRVRPAFRRYLADVPSVQLVNYQTPASLGLMFQTGHGPFADVRLRRAVALGINRAAVGRAVLGSDEAGVASPENPKQARMLLDAVRRERGTLAPIRLSFLSSLTEDQRAALVLEQQLVELGLEVRLEPAPMASALDMVKRGDFEILLTYAGTTPNYFQKLLGISAMIGYVNPDFAQAVAEGNSAQASEILERDVPVTPIVTTFEMVAVDRSFCGVHPIAISDLSWLADIHPCAAGESP